MQRFRDADKSSPLDGALVVKTLLRLGTAVALGAILTPWWLCMAPAGVPLAPRPSSLSSNPCWQIPLSRTPCMPSHTCIIMLCHVPPICTQWHRAFLSAPRVLRVLSNSWKMQRTSPGVSTLMILSSTARCHVLISGAHECRTSYCICGHVRVVFAVMFVRCLHACLRVFVFRIGF